MNSSSSTIWSRGSGPRPPEWLPPQHHARWQRISGARLLYRGNHREFFLQQRRTGFDFPEIRVLEQPQRLYCTANLLRMITLKTTDLCLGEAPAIRVDDPQQQDLVDNLVKRTGLHQVLYGSAKDASWAGECFVQVVRLRGEVYVVNLPPDELWPEGELLPDGQHESYVRYQIKTDNARTLVLVTRYVSGAIEREVRELRDGKLVAAEASAWGKGIVPREATGLDGNVIIWAAGEMEDGEPVSDYEAICEAQDRLNAKVTQIARVLAQHADPKLSMPQTAADADGNVRAGHDVFFFRSREDIPQYIVWNAELQSAIQDRDFALADMCVQSEISPVLLGLPGASVPDTARGLRLRATSAMSKAQRRAARLVPFIVKVIETARRMEQQASIGGQELLPVGVEMRDGLPVDEIDQANALATLRASGLLSRPRGVGLLVPDADAAAKEVTMLEAEQRQVTPSLLSMPEPEMEANEPQMNTDEQG
jgi:hypothetical protein